MSNIIKVSPSLYAPLPERLPDEPKFNVSYNLESEYVIADLRIRVAGLENSLFREKSRNGELQKLHDSAVRRESSPSQDVLPAIPIKDVHRLMRWGRGSGKTFTLRSSSEGPVVSLTCTVEPLGRVEASGSSFDAALQALSDKIAKTALEKLENI